MRVVLQRVSRARVVVAGRITGEIGRGFLLLVGFRADDTEETLRWMADKILSLRLFSDEEQKMNLGLEDVGGGVLVVSQFTLSGDTRKGRRPSFIDAMEPAGASALYRVFCDTCRALGAKVCEGVFRAEMKVSLVNEGPVTLLLDSRKLF